MTSFRTRLVVCVCSKGYKWKGALNWSCCCCVLSIHSLLSGECAILCPQLCAVSCRVLNAVISEHIACRQATSAGQSLQADTRTFTAAYWNLFYSFPAREQSFEKNVLGKCFIRPTCQWLPYISRHPWSTNRGFSIAAPLFFWFKDNSFCSRIWDTYHTFVAGTSWYRVRLHSPCWHPTLYLCCIYVAGLC